MVDNIKEDELLEGIPIEVLQLDANISELEVQLHKKLIIKVRIQILLRKQKVLF